MVRHGQIWFSENSHIIATFLWKLSEKNSKKPSEHFSAYNLSKNLIFLKIKIDHVSWSDHGQLWWSDPEPDDGQTMVNHGRPWSTMVWWSDCRRGRPLPLKTWNLIFWKVKILIQQVEINLSIIESNLQFELPMCDISTHLTSILPWRQSCWKES